MKENNKSVSVKRYYLKLLVGGTITSSLWAKPVINSIILPAHATSSTTDPIAPIPPAQCVACSESTYVAVERGARIIPPDPSIGAMPGPEAFIDIPMCIDDTATRVEIVATNNNPANATGLLFDEAITFTVNHPDGSVRTQAYTSFPDVDSCSGGATEIPLNTQRFDVTNLFLNDTGDLVCGSNYRVTSSQCNLTGRWVIGSFNFVVS